MKEQPGITTTLRKVFNIKEIETNTQKQELRENKDSEEKVTVKNSTYFSLSLPLSRTKSLGHYFYPPVFACCTLFL